MIWSPFGPDKITRINTRIGPERSALLTWIVNGSKLN